MRTASVSHAAKTRLVDIFKELHHAFDATDLGGGLGGQLAFLAIDEAHEKDRRVFSDDFNARGVQTFGADQARLDLVGNPGIVGTLR